MKLRFVVFCQNYLGQWCPLVAWQGPFFLVFGMSLFKKTGMLSFESQNHENRYDLCIFRLVFFDAGAIPLFRTNVPQLLLLPESTNNIWGQSANPWDPTRTPGGSSGGEAAAGAAGGSQSGIRLSLKGK